MDENVENSIIETYRARLVELEAESERLERERTLANGWGGDAVTTARTAQRNTADALAIWSDRARNAEARCEKADALLREVVVLLHPDTHEHKRITAHLSENNRDHS